MDIEKLSIIGKINYQQIIAAKEPFEHFQKVLEDPMRNNEEFLLKLLNDNKDTEYGKKYHFDEIHSIEEYQKRVPVTTYADYEEYIERMTEGCEENLICASPIHHYNKTSGTMGSPKKIPLSDAGQKIYNRCTAGYIAGILAHLFPELDWIDGRSLTILEARPTVPVLKCGATYGAISEKLLVEMKDHLNYLYCSPAEAYFPDPDTNTWYLHARFGLEDKNLTSISSTFFSFISELLLYIELNWETLVNDIENGTISENVQVSKKARESLANKIKPNPERAKELREIFSKGFDEPFIPKVWPKMKYIRSTGSAGYKVHVDRIRDRYAGSGIKQLKCGIASSEGLISIQYGMEEYDSVPVPDGMFYEFLPLDAGDDFSKIVTLDKLEKGKEYEVIITNASGFYRYRMRDAVKVVGKYKNTPTIDFLYRIDRTVSIMGEKTTEIALQNAINETAKALGFDIVSFSMLPEVESNPPRYCFYIEIERMPKDLTPKEIRFVLEQKLAEANPSMGDKVRRGICGPTKVNFLERDSYKLYRDIAALRGVSAMQVKPVTVIIKPSQKSFFDALTEYGIEA